MAATTFDTYGRQGTQDAGSPIPPGAPVAGSGNVSSVAVLRGNQAAGAGTTSDITLNVGYKCRVIDCWAVVNSGVASSVVQLFTQTAGGGTALSSSMSTASAATVRSNQGAATGVIAMGGNIYAHCSAGATLAGLEIFVTVCPEQ